MTENPKIVKRCCSEKIKYFFEDLIENPHKNLPVIISAGDGEYEMEYVLGRSLADIIENDGPLPCDKAKDFMLQLISACDHLHKFKIIHRDIKPDNIIIMADGTLKLIDFDIARIKTNMKNADTSLLGTMGYAAPEQYGFTETDERSDIYAIGIVYRYMLTGSISSDAKIEDREICRIIEKCTEPEPKHRYKNTKRLKKDISRGIFSAYKLSESIPGFRSKNPIKMAITVIVWFFVFSSLYNNWGDTEASIVYVASFIFLLPCILFYIILFNGANIVLRIRLPIKSFIARKIILLVFCYFLGVLFMSIIYIVGPYLSGDELSDPWYIIFILNPLFLMPVAIFRNLISLSSLL